MFGTLAQSGEQLVIPLSGPSCALTDRSRELDEDWTAAGCEHRAARRVLAEIETGGANADHGLDHDLKPDLNLDLGTSKSLPETPVKSHSFRRSSVGGIPDSKDSGAKTSGAKISGSAYVASGGDHIVMSTEILPGDLRNYAVIKACQATGLLRICLTIKSNTDHRDGIYALITGALSHARRLEPGADIVLEFAEPPAAPAAEGRKSRTTPYAMLLKDLGGVMRVKRRIELTGPTGAGEAGCLKFRLPKDTAHLLADYYDEADRRYRAAEGRRDAFVWHELRYILSQAPRKLDIGVVYGVIDGPAV